MQALLIQIMLVLLSLVTVFHLCIVAKIIPYHIAWGGRLQNDRQMYVFEAISLLVNLFLTAVLLSKGGYLDIGWAEATTDTILWVFCALFLLNTIGNIFAKTAFEKSFAVLTLLSSIMIWMILKGE